MRMRAAPYAVSPMSGTGSQSRPNAKRLVDRVAWALVALCGAAVLAIAAFLTPSPVGHSTHVQLGLPPCTFLVLTGLRCPGCGVTTAVAYLARGNLAASIRANPLGVPVFLVASTMLVGGCVAAVAGARARPTLRRLRIERGAALFIVSSLVVWLIRTTVRVAG